MVPEMSATGSTPAPGRQAELSWNAASARSACSARTGRRSGELLDRDQYRRNVQPPVRDERRSPDSRSPLLRRARGRRTGSSCRGRARSVAVLVTAATVHAAGGLVAQAHFAGRDAQADGVEGGDPVGGDGFLGGGERDQAGADGCVQLVLDCVFR